MCMRPFQVRVTREGGDEEKNRDSKKLVVSGASTEPE